MSALELGFGAAGLSWNVGTGFKVGRSDDLDGEDRPRCGVRRGGLPGHWLLEGQLGQGLHPPLASRHVCLEQAAAHLVNPPPHTDPAVFRRAERELLYCSKLLLRVRARSGGAGGRRGAAAAGDAAGALRRAHVRAAPH